MTLLRSLGVAAALVLIPMTGVSAEEFFWSHKDWHVTVTPKESEEDDHSICRATTGGDGDPYLHVEYFTGDAGPPDAYPTVIFQDYAPRGYQTMLRQHGDVDFTFSDGQSYRGLAEDLITDEGLMEAYASPLQAEDNLATLKAMRRKNQMVIIYEGTPYYTASLQGFSAAYRKLAEVCGFSVTGVLD